MIVVKKAVFTQKIDCYGDIGKIDRILEFGSGAFLKFPEFLVIFGTPYDSERKTLFFFVFPEELLVIDKDDIVSSERVGQSDVRI